MTRLRTVEIYRDDKRKLIAIEAVELNQSKFNRGGLLTGSLAPVVIIVCTPAGHEVLAVAADNANLETLKQRYAGLDELIVNACRKVPKQAQ